MLLGLSEDDTLDLVRFLSSLHDVGKFAQAFQAYAPECWPSALGALPGNGPKAMHTALGLGLWKSRIRDRVTSAVTAADPLALDILSVAVFGHHGRPTPPERFVSQWFSPAALRACDECVTDLMELLIADRRFDLALTVADARSASWWLSGVVTISDWIGSQQQAFPYRALADDLPGYWASARVKAERATAMAGLTPARARKHAGFAELTGGLSATGTQQWAATTELPDGPTLMIIEDATGSGKTEAAQMLVQRMLERGSCSGAYWAMPTQATANAMYARQHDAIARMFEVTGATRPTLVLAHGQSRLHPGFASAQFASVAASSSTDDRNEEADATFACPAFLADDRRASLIADVGAGTVDQALLSILPSKFATVRQFGLSTKVLLFDEVHAYDEYMLEELLTLMRFQATLGGSAIVLSATLTAAQRQQLSHAWVEGCSNRMLPRVPATQFEAAVATPYPLLSTVSSVGLDSAAPAPAEWTCRDVSIGWRHDVGAVVDLVLEAAGKGAAVAWIRNTVSDCLDAAAMIAARGTAVDVFHARFAQCDRQRIEAEILGRFGPKAPRASRIGRIVVATQVIEQSLDLDFDVLVTDLAPVDLVIQRAGRWRRHRSRDAERPADLEAGLIVLAPEWTEDPPEDWMKTLSPGTRWVYPDLECLWRSQMVLRAAGQIRAPGNIRFLLEEVYRADTDTPPNLRSVTMKARGKGNAAGGAAKFAVLRPSDGYTWGGTSWAADIKVPTRLGDDSIRVRLARADGAGAITPWCEDAILGSRAWALSEVAISASRLPVKARPPARHEAAISSLRAQWSEYEDAIPIIVLERDDHGRWLGQLEGDVASKARRYEYEPATGLQFR